MFLTVLSTTHPIDRLSRHLILVVAVLTTGTIGSARSQAQPAEAPPAIVNPLANHPFAAEFAACDSDQDGLLTEAEYLNRTGREKPQKLRDFKMFDLDGDQRLSLAEFVTVPVGQPDELRGTLADPVVVLTQTKLAELSQGWKGWDQGGDNLLDQSEFQSAAMTTLVPEIGRAVQQECRDRSRMPSSA
eukprot:TRINITY_DN47_c0_g2_i4.p1 TRINITY_DN47_c0_g2~~TRINITY_DN47_c0_g2_i4.p1  ORF type:complete len:188 (-),score=49.15 TRINITY_DN47_c0_g2_i4:122-685(-)